MCYKSGRYQLYDRAAGGWTTLSMTHNRCYCHYISDFLEIGEFYVNTGAHAHVGLLEVPHVKVLKICQRTKTL
jgi:hypothetical protein